MAITARDVIWLAGYLEGEGCFRTARSNGRVSTVISTASTDHDVISRVARMLGVNLYVLPKHKIETRKQVYSLQVSGVKSVGWMMMLMPLMGERRKNKIKEIIGAWKLRKTQSRAPKGQRTMALCHTDRVSVNLSERLCCSCYNRKQKLTRPERDRSGKEKENLP